MPPPAPPPARASLEANGRILAARRGDRPTKTLSTVIGRTGERSVRRLSDSRFIIDGLFLLVLIWLFLSILFLRSILFVSTPRIRSTGGVHLTFRYRLSGTPPSKIVQILNLFLVWTSIVVLAQKPTFTIWIRKHNSFTTPTGSQRIRNAKYCYRFEDMIVLQSSFWLMRKITQFERIKGRDDFHLSDCHARGIARRRVRCVHVSGNRDVGKMLGKVFSVSRVKRFYMSFVLFCWE
jgi:hypothetical protein